MEHIVCVAGLEQNAPELESKIKSVKRRCHLADFSVIFSLQRLNGSSFSSLAVQYFLREDITPYGICVNGFEFVCKRVECQCRAHENSC